MAGIEIDLNSLYEALKKADKVKKDYFEQHSLTLSQKTIRLDSRILNKYNIHTRISNVLTRMSGLTSSMEGLKTYINSVENNVNEAEKKIEHSLEKYLADTLTLTGAGAVRKMSANDMQFSSSGSVHGGSGRPIEGASHGGGGRSIDGLSIDLANEMLNKKQFPFAAIPAAIGTGAGYLKENWLDYVSAYSDVSDIAQLLGITKDDGALSQLVDAIGINKPLRSTVKYINSISEYMESIEQGEYSDAAAKAIGIGEDALIDVIGSGIPGAGMVKDLGNNIGTNLAESYQDYWNNPSFETFGKMAFKSTIKATSDMAFDTGFNIIDKVPGGNMITDYYRNNTGGKTGAEAFYDAGSQIVDAVKEGSEQSGGFGNFYMEGVELMVDGIKDKAVSGYNYVVNGFKSIFHK